MIGDLMHDTTEGLCKRFEASYTEAIDDYNDNKSFVLKNGFGMSEEATYQELRRDEQLSYDFTVSEVRMAFKTQANNVLSRQFNTLFKKNDEGHTIDWTKVEEGKIREMLETAKTKIEHQLISEFKRIALPKNLTTVDNSPQQVFQTPGADVIKRDTSARSVILKTIITESEIAALQQRFNDDCEFAYEEAMARHVIFSLFDLSFCVAQHHRWQYSVLDVRASRLVCK